MDEQEISEHRYRFFSEKGIQTAVQHDRVLVTLFTGIIAGLIALLVSEKAGFWSGIFFLLADTSAVVGLGMCLLHMAFTSKVMSLLAALFAGEENVPNVVAREEPTTHVINKNRAFAQLCFAGQLICLLWSVLFGGLGLAGLLSDVVGWLGLLTACSFMVLLVTSMLYPLVKVYALARRMLELERGREGEQER